MASSCSVIESLPGNDGRQASPAPRRPSMVSTSPRAQNTRIVAVSIARVAGPRHTCTSPHPCVRRTIRLKSRVAPWASATSTFASPGNANGANRVVSACVWRPSSVIVKPAPSINTICRSMPGKREKGTARSTSAMLTRHRKSSLPAQDGWTAISRVRPNPFFQRRGGQSVRRMITRCARSRAGTAVTPSACRCHNAWPPPGDRAARCDRGRSRCGSGARSTG